MIGTLFVSDGYRLALSGRWSPTPAEQRWGDPEVATLEEIETLPGSLRPSRPEPTQRPERPNLKRLSQGGVAIAAGTDAGNIGTLHGPSIFRELRLMVEAGMTASQVIVAATRAMALGSWAGKASWVRSSPESWPISWSSSAIRWKTWGTSRRSTGW